MRNIGIVAMGLFAGLGIASAQEGRGPGRGRGGPNVAFTLLDANSDGVLDETEIAAAPAALAKLDKDGDGQITSDEVRQAMPQGRGRGGFGPGRGRGEQQENANADVVEETVKTLMAFDENGDGKLSKAELPERYQGIFERGDADHDGFLTPDEIRKVAAAQATSAGPGGRDGGGREGDGGRAGEGGRGGPRGDMNFIRFDPILAAIDTNGDGILSADEIRNSADAIRKLDKNGDGKVSRDEVTPAGRGREF